MLGIGTCFVSLILKIHTNFRKILNKLKFQRICSQKISKAKCNIKIESFISQKKKSYLLCKNVEGIALQNCFIVI